MSEVRSIAVPPDAEPFVDRKELAGKMGVSVDTVDRLVKAGMPSVTWGRRLRRFKASVAMQWANEYQAKKAA